MKLHEKMKILFTFATFFLISNVALGANYVVNAVDENGTAFREIASGTSDKNVTVSLPKYIFRDRTLYELQINQTALTKTVTISGDNDVVETCEYKKKDVSNVVFFTEAEDIDGVTVGEYAYNSNGKYATTPTTCPKVTDLPAGKYVIYMGVRGISGGKAVSYKFYTDKSTSSIFEGEYSSSYLGEVKSETIIIVEKSTISFSCKASKETGRGGADYIYITREVDPVVVLEAFETKVNANGNFTGSDCTTSVAFTNSVDKTADNISEVSPNKDNNGKVYRTGDCTSITLNLKTSVSQIVVAGLSSGKDRYIDSIYVNGVALILNKETITNGIKSSSAIGKIIIPNLQIADNSTVTLKFSGNVKIFYFELTPWDGINEKSDNTTPTVTVHGMDISAPVVDEDGEVEEDPVNGKTFTYKIGTGYTDKTIDFVVKPKDDAAYVKVDKTTYTAGASATVTATIGTPKTFTVIAEDGTEGIYTINAERVETKTLDGRQWIVAAGEEYYEAHQIVTSKGEVTMTFSSTIGMDGISTYTYTNQVSNDYTHRLNVGSASNPKFDANGIPTSGTYYKFDVARDGDLYVYVLLGKDKNITVTDKTDKLTSGTDYTTELKTDNNNYQTGYVKIPVTKDNTYYIYAAGSKLPLYGFKYEPAYLELTLSYSSDRWDGITGHEPTLSAKDEDGNTVDISSLTMSYVSDDPTVATVGTDGTITVVNSANGIATIYAKAAASEKYSSATALVIVDKMQGVRHSVYERTSNYKLNERIELKDENKNLLLTAVLGGWKYNDGTYKFNGKNVTDSWGDISDLNNGVNMLDGFSKVTIAATDACDEAKEASIVDGVTHYGWFQNEKPFTLPCRGGYMTFEPKYNGTVTVYVQQNGGFNSETNSDKKVVIKHGEFRKHAFYLVDQNGVSVASYDKVMAICKDAIDIKNPSTKETYYFNLDEATATAEEKNNNNIATWAETQKYFSESERKAIADAWNTGTNGYQQVVTLDDGSYFVTQKEMVKYTFHALAGQTYYLFSNFSKLGFAGVNFVKDAATSQPSTKLSLSENIAYTAPTKTATSTLPKMYSEITLDRSFSKDYWSSICLPFSLTADEVEEVFGEGTQLVVLDNVKIEGWRAYITLTYHEIQNLLAGYPYFIKPSKDVAANTISIKNKGIDPDTKLVTYDNDGYTAKGVFSGDFSATVGGTTYSALTKLNEGDIFLGTNNNTLKKSTGKTLLKGYRCYLEMDQESSAAKAVTEFILRTGDAKPDNTTGIDMVKLASEIEASLTSRASHGVYNLNGQKVSDTLMGLPKGLYIVDGRKYIVQ